jgi:hypothetical protein
MPAGACRGLCLCVIRILLLSAAHHVAMHWHHVAQHCRKRWRYIHTLLQGMRPVFVGADLGRTPLSAALAQAGHLASEPTLFVAGDASCAR